MKALYQISGNGQFLWQKEYTGTFLEVVDNLRADLEEEFRKQDAQICGRPIIGTKLIRLGYDTRESKVHTIVKDGAFLEGFCAAVKMAVNESYEKMRELNPAVQEQFRVAKEALTGGSRF